MTALGVLCCFALFVCLTLLASFFLPSHLSFKNMYMRSESVAYEAFFPVRIDELLRTAQSLEDSLLQEKQAMRERLQAILGML